VGLRKRHGSSGASLSSDEQERAMSKGLDKKKDTKKKAAKTLLEKRAAKKQKKDNRIVRV